MSKNKKNKNYILFYFCKHYNETKPSWKLTYYDRKGLVNKLAINKLWYGDRGIENNLVDSLEVYYDVPFYYSYYDIRTKYYLAKVNSGVMRKLEYSELNDEIIKEVTRIRKVRDAEHSAHMALDRSYKYEFRRGHVPRIHNYNNYHRGCYHRLPETHSNRAKAVYVDTEYGYKLVDIKTKNLPNSYDDLARHNDKSWKTSYKVKKQWMKHLDKHIDTI